MELLLDYWADLDCTPKSNREANNVHGSYQGILWDEPPPTMARGLDYIGNNWERRCNNPTKGWRVWRVWRVA